MNQRPGCRRAVVRATAFCAMAVFAGGLLAVSATSARAQTPRRGSKQPLDGPNVTSPGDLAAGSLVDSFFSPLAPADPLPAARAKAVGVQPSKASQRSSWAARLVRNPKTEEGNPPYALVDRYGGVQRYVEPVPQVDLEKYLGQTVTVRRDTGHTLLASQLDLPRTASPKRAAASREGKSIRLAAADEPLPAIEPTPAESEGSATTADAGSTPELASPGEVIEGEITDGQIVDEHGNVMHGPAYEDTGHPMMLPEGVDPLYVDEGMHGDCCECGDPLCGGSCNPCAKPVFYARGEYLLWWFDGMDTPPLVVSSPNANFTQSEFIFGNEEILDGSRNGGRVIAGFWSDDAGTWGLEGDFFTFEREDLVFVAGDPLINFQTPPPFIGRPFFNVTPFNHDGNAGTPDRPGLRLEEVETNNISGSVTVVAESEFRSAGVALTRNLCCRPGCATECGDCVDCCSGVGCGAVGCGSGLCTGCGDCVLGQWLGGLLRKGTRHTDMRLGIRWAELDEGLGIEENLVSPPLPAAPAATFLLNDSFSTNNQFVGGELGFLWEWMYRRWSLEMLSKLAIGNTRQQVSIRGSTVFDRGTALQSTETGGLLALSTNIGDYERDEFSMIPEIGVTAGYLLTDRLRVTIGYTLLYWSNVVRPGDQIDFQINPVFIPRAPGTPPAPIPGDNPRFEFQQTDLWAQGLNVGLDYRY